MSTDFIPDVIPVVGHLDDAAVVGFVLQMVRSDLDEYMAWRKRSGLDEIRSARYAV